MPWTDLTLDELRDYRSAVKNPEGFDAFWSTTLAESRAAGGDVTLTPAATPITELIVEDIIFPGFGGEPVRGWVSRPRSARPLPTVIQYQGYGGGRGLAHERLEWAASGFCHILMDTRGQGSVWGNGGSTADDHGSGPATPGFMTRGIESADTYYYRRLFTDGARLVDAARALSFVNPASVAVTGGSQGGGIALAVAGLVPDIAAVLPDVPFLSDFPRSIRLTPQAPFTELTTYLSVHRDRVDHVFEVLGFFDGVNFARRATAPARFSVGLMDDVVLPSSVFAAYNDYAGADREIDVYEFNGHEGGQGHQWVRQVEWLRERL